MEYGHREREREEPPCQARLPGPPPDRRQGVQQKKKSIIDSSRYNTVVLLDGTNIGPSWRILPGGNCRNNATNMFLTGYDCRQWWLLYILPSFRDPHKMDKMGQTRITSDNPHRKVTEELKTKTADAQTSTTYVLVLQDPGQRRCLETGAPQKQASDSEASR